MPSCLFCRIAARELPSAELADTADAFAFLDINPVAPGHALIVPKTHAAKLHELSPTSSAAIMELTRRLVPALCKSVGAPDATIAIHDGPAAGQEIPHLHIHVIPRKPGDGGGPVHNLFQRPPRPDPEELNDLAIDVQVALGKK
jgi:histidine triad (HIT) family protein